MKTHVESVDEWLNLPEPHFPNIKDSAEQGTVYHVEKVGFLMDNYDKCVSNGIKPEKGPGDKGILPTAILVFSGEPQLCRLPIELTAWVFDAVAMAQAGMNVFPSDVEFGVLDGRTYAEHLI